MHRRDLLESGKVTRYNTLVDVVTTQRFRLLFQQETSSSGYYSSGIIARLHHQCGPIAMMHFKVSWGYAAKKRDKGSDIFLGSLTAFKIVLESLIGLQHLAKAKHVQETPPPQSMRLHDAEETVFS